MFKLSTDPAFSDGLKAVALIRDAAAVLDKQFRAHEAAVTQRIKDNTAILEAHINDPDLRPKFVFSSTKGIFTAAFNNQIYRFGPRENLNDLDDDEDKYFWTDPNNLTHYAPSSTNALLMCINHFCKRGQV